MDDMHESDVTTCTDAVPVKYDWNPSDDEEEAIPKDASLCTGDIALEPPTLLKAPVVPPRAIPTVNDSSSELQAAIAIEEPADQPITTPVPANMDDSFEYPSDEDDVVPSPSVPIVVDPPVAQPEDTPIAAQESNELEAAIDIKQAAVPAVVDPMTAADAVLELICRWGLHANATTKARIGHRDNDKRLNIVP